MRSLPWRVDPGQCGLPEFRAIQAQRVDVQRNPQRAGQLRGINEAPPDGQIELFSQVAEYAAIVLTPFDKLLTLRAIRAVVILGDAAKPASGSSGDSPKLAIAEFLKLAVRAVGLDHADIFAGEQVVKHHARRHFKSAGTVRIQRGFVFAIALDVSRQRGGNPGGDALRLFVIFYVIKPIQNGMKDRCAARLMEAPDELEMQEVFGANDLCIE